MIQPKPQVEHGISRVPESEYPPIYDRMVALLTCFRYMKRSQIERFIWGRNSLSTERQSRRHLKRLLDARVVKRFRFSKAYIYCLKNPEGMGRIYHDLMIPEVALTFPSWDWLQTDVDVGGIVPDLYVQAEGKDYFIEVDMATEPSDVIERKLRNYKEAIEASEFLSASWPEARVLFICPTESRSRFLVKAVEKAKVHFPVFITEFARLMAGDMAGRIWLTIGETERRELS